MTKRRGRVCSRGRRTERAARWLACAQPYVEQHRPLVVNCGDILAPSLMSTMTHGLHMVETIQLLGVHVAVPGNRKLASAARP